MTAVGSVRPGGRTARTRRAVLTAARHELVEHGYAGFVMERVARRAGVNKATIYRRWGGRRQLVLDLGSAVTQGTLVVADTGAVEKDLHVFAMSLLKLLTGPNGALTGAVMGAAAIDAELSQGLRRFFQDRYEAVTVIARRAIDRGELPPDTDPDQVVRQVAAPLYYRFLVTHEPLNSRVAHQAVSTTLLAARNDLLSQPWSTSTSR